MNSANQFASQVLSQSSRALAGYAAAALLDSRPEAKEGFGPDPLSAWQSWLGARIDELAAAAATGRPKILADQVLWAKAVLSSRGVSPENLRTALESLRTVILTELPEQALSTTTDFLDQALIAFDEQSTEVATGLLPETTEGRLAAAYLLAIFEGDRRRAAGLILEALSKGADVRDLCLYVLLPAQREVGRMWMANEINVAEEHFASATSKMVMAQLLQHASIAPSNGKTMLAAAVAGDQHDIGLQVLADLFEMDGWRVIQLGANLPIADLVEAVAFFKADLVALSASQSVQLETVRDSIRAIRDQVKGTESKILVGGPAFDATESLYRELGADGYSDQLPEALTQGRLLVGLPASSGNAPD